MVLSRARPLARAAAGAGFGALRARARERTQQTFSVARDTARSRRLTVLAALNQADARTYAGIVSQYGTYDAIAGYTPATDVTAHAAIDLDMTAINDYAGSGDFDSAIDMYKNGGNSAKGSGWRTLHGFGVKDLSGETEYDMGVTYWALRRHAALSVKATCAKKTRGWSRARTGEVFITKPRGMVEDT